MSHLPLLQADTTRAHYKETGVPHYSGNPLIEALPSILSEKQAVKALAHAIPYDNAQRELPSHIRQHLIQPILQFFEPLPAHVELEGKIARMLRFGYVGRNPTSRGFWREIGDRAEQLRENMRVPTNGPIPVTPTSFTIVGTSGTGKTTAVNRIMALHPQVIEHARYKGVDFPHKQLVWLKLECPFDGSVKGLCYKFFQGVDQILGTNYYQLYAKSRVTTDELLPNIARVAAIHTLGTMIIDEVQHLSTAKSGGQDKMLNFFVELTNTMQLPILLIGTTKAISALSREFRSVRRGTGQGEMIWRPMKKDDEWELFIGALWRYQYTSHESPLTPEVSGALYDECQGITDFAVKLYMLAQIRAISTRLERITETIIRSIGKDSLHNAQPFLQALRTGDYSKLQNFEDIIQPLDYAALAEQETRRQPIRLVENSREETVEGRTAAGKGIKLGVPKKTMKRGPKRIKTTSNQLINLAKEAMEQHLPAYQLFRQAGIIAPVEDFRCAGAQA